MCYTQFDHQYSESGGLDFEFFIISKIVYLKNKADTLIQHTILSSDKHKIFLLSLLFLFKI